MKPRHTPVLFALFTVSGAAALIYQVLWVRELGLLFGSTAEAAALTIAIFFSGIALGGWWFGRRAGSLRKPLAIFGFVEIGVALTALGHFLVAKAYFALYPALYGYVDGAPILETALKALVAATILLPSAFLMGGTLPLMGQHVIRNRAHLGRLGSALYALNTAGGAAGALAAGFFLPVWLGFSGAYLLAVSLDVLVGLAAILIAARSHALPPLPAAEEASLPPAGRGHETSLSTSWFQWFSSKVPSGSSLPMLWTIAFVSGFATLATEIIWTRLFAQVLQNSVYTYALVLAVFLASLSLGATLAHGLSRSRASPEGVLAGLLAASCAMLVAMPYIFHHATDGLAYLGGRADFAGYVAAVSRTALLTMLIPGIILGAVLPYLLRLMQADHQPGAVLGRLIAINTFGAILGALAGGFLILPLFGAWKGLWLMAALYSLLLWVLAGRRLSFSWNAIRLATLGMALYLMIGSPGLASIRLGAGDVLVAMREGSSAHVAVIDRGDSREIRVNNFYTLGSTGARIAERNQTLIPLLTHPSPREIFFLGLGTGITAGAALLAEPERITVCELLADVIELARAHFTPYLHGLFDDPRVRIHAEDGRQCLARSRETYDLIIADLFTPWRAGVGSIYTRDHYRLASRRLNPGGAYVQWVPLYQVSRDEFDIIAATMASVFPELTLWRGDFYPQRSIVALVGRMTPAPLDPDVLGRQWQVMTGSTDPVSVLTDRALKFYAGHAAAGLLAGVPLNTDNHPLIEYRAPRTHRAVIAGTARWLTGTERDHLYARWMEALPPEIDPYLSRLSPAQLGLVRAGALYAAWHGAYSRGAPEAASLWQDFLEMTPAHARHPDSPAGSVERDRLSFGDPHR